MTMSCSTIFHYSETEMITLFGVTRYICLDRLGYGVVTNSSKISVA